MDVVGGAMSVWGWFAREKVFEHGRVRAERAGKKQQQRAIHIGLTRSLEPQAGSVGWWVSREVLRSDEMRPRGHRFHTVSCQK